MLGTAQIGEVPVSPERYYRPLVSESPVSFDLSVESVPYIADAVEDLRRGLMPAPHNAGLVSCVPYEHEQDVVDDQDLVVFDLVSLAMGRNTAMIMPTDRRGVAKHSGAVQVDGAVAMTRLDTGLVVITHITSKAPSAWERVKVPSIPRIHGRRRLESLGYNAIQLELLDSAPNAGLARMKRRVPVYSFSRNAPANPY